jgi:hypothetical protein
VPHVPPLGHGFQIAAKVGIAANRRKSGAPILSPLRIGIPLSLLDGLRKGLVIGAAAHDRSPSPVC